MGNVVVSTVIERPIAVVWDDIRRLDSHVEWMADAETIRFLTDDHAGIGTRFECDTKVGPLRTTDVMEVTEWVEGERIGVRHIGLVTGVGAFILHPVDADRTEFRWDETLSFPWWFGGRIGAVVAHPLLAAIWRRNLRRLRQRLESQ